MIGECLSARQRGQEDYDEDDWNCRNAIGSAIRCICNPWGALAAVGAVGMVTGLGILYAEDIHKDNVPTFPKVLLLSGIAVAALATLGYLFQKNGCCSAVRCCAPGEEYIEIP